MTTYRPRAVPETMSGLRQEMPVVVTEPDALAPPALVELRRFGPVTLGPFDRQELLCAVADAEILMVRLSHNIDREVLSAATNLRAVISATTGLNHIDVTACQERNIEIVCTRGERAFLSTITGTAELALALLLNLARHIVVAYGDVLAGNWRRDAFRGTSLRGLTLGIIGMGRLGYLMAEYSQALGMRVLGFDSKPLVVPPYAEMTSLEDVLRRSDAISLHASHREGEPPILTANSLAQCRPGVLVVNTARGELVDETAMLHALESGQVGGYGTDVIADEATTDIANHPVIRYAREHDNVIVAPHIGGATLDGLQRAESFVVGKALSHFGLIEGG